MSDPHERRDWLVGGAVRAAKAHGQEIDVDAVARQAGRDLEVVDRARASGDIGTGASRKRKVVSPEEKPKKSNASKLDDLARSKQSRIYERPLDATPEPASKVIPVRGLEAERLIAMHARVALICKPVPGYKLKSSEPLGNQCQYPALANPILMHTACMARGLGRYKGLSLDERQRKYNTEIERICDLSNAVIGVGWWVPK